MVFAEVLAGITLTAVFGCVGYIGRTVAQHGERTNKALADLRIDVAVLFERSGGQPSLTQRDTAERHANGN
jgi:hypothetical protein